MDLRDLVKLAGIVNPELLNKLEPTAEVEEADSAGFEDATTRPQEEMMDDPLATMGSAADTSLRRYLKAKGDHVTVDEEIYPDHTVESVTEAYAEFKEGKYGKKKKYNEEPVDEADIDENAFNQAAAAAARAGKDTFEFGGKTHKTTMKKDVAHKLDDDINRLRSLSGVAEGSMKQADIEVQEWAEKYNTKTGVNGDELANGWMQAMLNSGIMSDSYDQDEYIAFNKKYGYEDDMEWEEDDMDKFFAESPITRSMHDEANAIMKKYGIDENDFNDMLGYMESKNESPDNSIDALKQLAGI